MCKAVEDFGKKERMEERKQTTLEFIKKLIKKGSPFTEIADDFGVSVEEVEKIAASMA